jgi:hypothetical protein
MIARKSGDRTKSDKRDVARLAMPHRGGLLTVVWVPDVTHEAMCDLIRARLAAVRTVRKRRALRGLDTIAGAGRRRPSMIRHASPSRPTSWPIPACAIGTFLQQECRSGAMSKTGGVHAARC